MSVSAKKFVRSLSLAFARRQLRCVFVLSTGRVGTETLTNVLDLSPSIRAVHEPEPVMLEESQSCYRSGIDGQRDFADLYFRNRLLRGSLPSDIRDCVREGYIYAETSNRLTYAAEGLAAYFPRSQFIHLHRHPADVVRSTMRREYYHPNSSNSWDRFRISPTRDDRFFESWSSWDSFQKCCWYWRTVNESALSVVQKLGSQRARILPATAIFERDVSAIHDLFCWMNAAPPSTEQLTTELSTRYNEQQSGDFPHWRDWSQEMVEQLTQIAGPVTHELGYKLETGQQVIGTSR